MPCPAQANQFRQLHPMPWMRDQFGHPIAVLQFRQKESLRTTGARQTAHVQYLTGSGVRGLIQNPVNCIPQAIR